MPQITIKGLTDKQMRAISTPLIPKLAEAIGCPEDWLILELAHSSFYAGGEQVPGFPIVEVSSAAFLYIGQQFLTAFCEGDELRDGAQLSPQ